MPCSKNSIILLFGIVATWQPMIGKQIAYVNFNTSMGEAVETVNLDHKGIGSQSSRVFYKFLKKLYEINFVKKMPEKNLLIPKRIHQIWLGPALPPPSFKKWQRTIRQLHPDWHYKLWTDKDIARLSLYNKNLYEKSKNYGERSDILRYEILYRYGGVYLDIDFECLKSLEPLHYSYQFYTALLPIACKSCLANGIIASVPGHPILRQCIATISRDWPRFHILQRAGPQHFEKAFWRVASAYKGKIIAFPASYFFPITLAQSKEHLTPQQIKALIKPETFALHYWTGTWTNTVAQIR